MSPQEQHKAGAAESIFKKPSSASAPAFMEIQASVSRTAEEFVYRLQVIIVSGLSRAGKIELLPGEKSHSLSRDSFLPDI